MLFAAARDLENFSTDSELRLAGSHLYPTDEQDPAPGQDRNIEKMTIRELAPAISANPFRNARKVRL
jgi:hypothetical protein